MHLNREYKLIGRSSKYINFSDFLLQFMFDVLCHIWDHNLKLNKDEAIIKTNKLINPKMLKSKPVLKFSCVKCIEILSE